MRLSLSFPMLAVAAGLALSGCSKEATGQVAAVVNGEEVTLQEINAELGNANLPEGVDRERAQQAALQRIIDRRVMAQAAREDGVDETPEYIMRKRQLDDALLVQLMTQKIQQTMAVPETTAIDKFIADNPVMFGNRTIFSLDRIQFAAPEDMNRLRVLENDHSMEAVAATLNRLGIDFQRGQTEMDSMQLGKERLDRIRSLPDGEPFVVAENGIVYVAVITGSRPLPITGEQARPLALQAMRNQKVMEALQQRLKTEKDTAEISYQDGFAPAKADAAPKVATQPAK